MATAPDWSCPICHEALEDVVSLTSCCHEFCLGCIIRWAKKNPTCPLCRRPVNAFIYSVHPGQEFLEMVLLQPSVSLAAGPQAEQEAAAPVSMAYVGGFPPKTWALFFRNYTEILEPVQVWLNEVLLAACWWDVALAQGRIISYLCRYGLDEELLVRELQPLLRDQTVTFVHQLISVAMEQCYEQVQLLVEAHSAQTAGGHGQMERGHGANLVEMAASHARGLQEPCEERGQAVEHTSNDGWRCSQRRFQEPPK